MHIEEGFRFDSLFYTLDGKNFLVDLLPELYGSPRIRNKPSGSELIWK